MSRLAFLVAFALTLCCAACDDADPDSGPDSGQDAELDTDGDEDADVNSENGEEDADAEAPDADADNEPDADADTADEPDADAGDDGPLEFAFDFADGDEGWAADVADYSIGQEETIDFQSGVEALPEEIDDGRTGFRLRGHNVSDDLAMFLRRELGPDDGIEAGADYKISYQLTFASDAPTGCAGIGGAPGESVFLKAGAANAMPEPVEEDDFVALNVDKGNQSQGGPAASVLGHIANGINCEEAIENDYPYVSLERDHDHEARVTADDEGRLWLLVLTDSGFEGATEIFYEQIEVELTQVE